MDEQNNNYKRVAEAIEYIQLHFKKQPHLDEIAQKIHVSPFHFQRLFTDWAGISPKKFLQYISIEYTKNILKQQGTLFDAAHEAGLSGTGRLHDLFITIEGMTPGEFKQGGENLQINYSYNTSPFGDILIASTPKGICFMAFVDDKKDALAELQKNFPKAQYEEKHDALQQNALKFFTQDAKNIPQIKLHLKGTKFQLKVWHALLKIPLGQLSTYGNIASLIKNPKACRTVGSAIGHNPVSFLIPCHRIIQSSGIIGQYHWGSTRKVAMIGWEGAQKSQSSR